MFYKSVCLRAALALLRATPAKCFARSVFPMFATAAPPSLAATPSFVPLDATEAIGIVGDGSRVIGVTGINLRVTNWEFLATRKLAAMLNSSAWLLEPTALLLGGMAVLIGIVFSPQGRSDRR
jgi:hypothetical protein